MYDYNALCQEIEAEYDAFCADRSRDLSELYSKLFLYLKHEISRCIKSDSYGDDGAAEDLTQEVLIVITEIIHTFEKKGTSQFALYCRLIARNKAFDYVKRRKHCKNTSEEELESVVNKFDSSKIFSNPEKLIMEYEYRLELIAQLKRYLRTMIDWPQEPYRTVASCYTTILFHRYHPDTKKLGSPGWAYETVEEKTVYESAERFMRELNEWLTHIRMDWSDEFLDAMDEMQDGESIGDIVFGQRFKVKDFENWSNRLRENVKKHLKERAVKEETEAFEPG